MYQNEDIAAPKESYITGQTYQIILKIFQIYSYLDYYEVSLMHKTQRICNIFWLTSTSNIWKWKTKNSDTLFCGMILSENPHLPTYLMVSTVWFH